jgi:eukaryotic-like serine/threonine-protein kinase
VALAAGSRLGPYEIVAPIGAGGMGEVYRAKDPRLGRDVAIKVLPAAFSSDADRLKRFEQEARAAGVLNHPNVTIVYDVGQHDGAPYVVQELLEGETLRAELAGGRLSARKAVDYAIEIARGLAAAHEKSIVHRDLKPENLFVTNDGRVKILDFGLAKLTQADSSGNTTNLPTATESGVVMGTLGYMSPEQIKAKPADARSDIFALGAILYEMLSGQRAFRGDSAGETMAAILKEDPPDLSVTNQKISPGLERIVRHSLEKNPERRFQSASDLAFDLEELSAPSGAAIARPAARPGRRLLWPALALLAALVGVGLGALWMSSRRPSPPSYQQVTFRRGSIPDARFAPDGQTVVFAASWDGSRAQLYSLRPGSPAWSPLNLGHLLLMSVSRSGELAVLNVPEGSEEAGPTSLARVPMAGGSPREVLNDVEFADWSPDGSALAVAHLVGGVGQVEFPIGRVLYKSSSRIGSLRVSPDGQQVAFVDNPIAEQTLGSVVVVDRSGKARTLSDGWFDVDKVAWSPNAKEIWFSASGTGARRSIWAVTPAGRLRPLAETPGSTTILDVSPRGQALLKHESWRAYISGVPPGATSAQDFTWLDYSLPTDLSDDGKLLLFQEWGEGGGTKGAVYLRNFDGSPPVHLGEGFGMGFSPDGHWVLARLYTNPPQLILLPTGAGQPKPLPIDGLLLQWGAWFPDGKKLLLLATAGGETAYYSLDPAGGKPRRIAAATSAWAHREIDRGRISPDGRRLARRGGDDRVSILSLADGAETAGPVLLPGEQVVRWHADGLRLFVVRREGNENVFSLLDPEGRREPWQRILISPDPVGLRGGPGPIQISADGKAVFWGYQKILDELYLVDGLK